MNHFRRSIELSRLNIAELLHVFNETEEVEVDNLPPKVQETMKLSREDREDSFRWSWPQEMHDSLVNEILRAEASVNRPYYNGDTALEPHPRDDLRTSIEEVKEVLSLTDMEAGHLKMKDVNRLMFNKILELLKDSLDAM